VGTRTKVAAGLVSLAIAGSRSSKTVAFFGPASCTAVLAICAQGGCRAILAMAVTGIESLIVVALIYLS
jgi:hypothetical protein